MFVLVKERPFSLCFLLFEIFGKGKDKKTKIDYDLTYRYFFSTESNIFFIACNIFSLIVIIADVKHILQKLKMYINIINEKIKRTILITLVLLMINQYFLNAQEKVSPINSNKIGITFSSFGENDIFRFEELVGAAS